MVCRISIFVVAVVSCLFVFKGSALLPTTTQNASGQNRLAALVSHNSVLYKHAGSHMYPWASTVPVSLAWCSRNLWVSLNTYLHLSSFMGTAMPGQPPFIAYCDHVIRLPNGMCATSGSSSLPGL